MCSFYFILLDASSKTQLQIYFNEIWRLYFIQIGVIEEETETLLDGKVTNFAIPWALIIHPLVHPYIHSSIRPSIHSSIPHVWTGGCWSPLGAQVDVGRMEDSWNLQACKCERNSVLNNFSTPARSCDYILADVIC